MHAGARNFYRPTTTPWWVPTGVSICVTILLLVIEFVRQKNRNSKRLEEAWVKRIDKTFKKNLLINAKSIIKNLPISCLMRNCKSKVRVAWTAEFRSVNQVALSEILFLTGMTALLGLKLVDARWR